MVGNTKSAASVTETLSGSDYFRPNVETKGGAEKIVNATAACRGVAADLNARKVLIWALAAFVGVSSNQLIL